MSSIYKTEINCALKRVKYLGIILVQMEREYYLAKILIVLAATRMAMVI
jgi:hypothetical protein